MVLIDDIKNIIRRELRCKCLEKKYCELHIILKSIDELPITPDQWKGKSGVKITRIANEFTIVEYQKEGRGAKPQKITHYVKIEDVNALLKYIKETINDKKITNYNKLRIKIQEAHGLTHMNKYEFLGKRDGGNSAYFTYYYYPIKVLQYYEIVEYKRNTKLLDEKFKGFVKEEENGKK